MRVAAVTRSSCLWTERRGFLQQVADRAFRRVLAAAGAQATFEKDAPLVTESKRKLQLKAGYAEGSTLATRVQAAQSDNPNRLTPEKLRVSRDRKTLIIEWNQPALQRGQKEATRYAPTRLLAEVLRAHSTSTDVAGSKALIYGKRGLTITDVLPAGMYGVRLVFSDGHSGGIFPYFYLNNLGENKFAVMRAYLKQLKRKGKAREIAVRRKSIIRPVAADNDASSCKKGACGSSGCSK